MEKPIKYKRFKETLVENKIQEFLDKLVTEGWEIIYYNEVTQSIGTLASDSSTIVHITIIGCKKQNNVL